MSTGTLKAIETRYKGFRFRSRLEARWAVFFDALGISWSYEPEGFELGRAGRYLPDFWLPDLRMWVEIKPEQPTFNGDAWKKAVELLSFQGWPVCFFFSVPGLGRGGVGVRNDMADSGGGLGYDDPICWIRCRSCGLFTVSLGDARHLVVNKDWGAWRDSPCCEKEANWDSSDLLLREAVEAARGARFEFGESGTR
jgi:hypothetical protein